MDDNPSNTVRLSASDGRITATIGDGPSWSATAESVPRAILDLAIDSRSIDWPFDETPASVDGPWPVLSGPGCVVRRHPRTKSEPAYWQARMVDRKGAYEASASLSAWRALANLAMLLIEREAEIDVPVEA